MAWLIQRGNVWYIGWREGNKDRYESTGTSDPELAETKKLTKELSLRVATDTLPESPDTLFSQLVELYKKQVKLAPKTLATNTYSWNHFKRLIGDLAIGSVSSETILAFDSRLEEEHFSNASRSIYLRDVKKVFRFAHSEGMIKKNPCRTIALPEEENVAYFISVEEEAKLMAVANILMRRIMTVALETGLRLSQIVFMDWKNYNIKEKLYFVAKQKRQKARNIPMFPKALEAMGPVKLSGRVFPEANVDQVEHMWQRIVDNAGIEPAEPRFHDLRHTCASRLAKILSPYELRDFFGWSSVAMCDRYTHTRVNDIRQKIAQGM